MKKKTASMVLTALMPVVYLAVAIALVCALSQNGSYPSGSYAMHHLYRGNAVYNAVGQGIIYPFYDTMWFSGTELLRNTPPLSAYLLALCQALAGGNMFSGYLLFVAMLQYVSALAWLNFGAKQQRPVLGAALGLIWFFLPYNLYALFTEGDLARALAVALLPFLIHAVCTYMQSGSAKMLPPIGILTGVITLCHAGFAMVCVFCIAVLMLAGFLFEKGKKGRGQLICALIGGVMLAGVWLVPYFTSGIMAWSFDEAMEASFQSLAQSLSPIRAYAASGAGAYLGIGVAVLIIMCALFAPRTSRSAAVAAAVLVILSTRAAYAVIRYLPGSDHLRLVWVFPAVCAFAFAGLIAWRELRYPAAVALCILVAADAVPMRSLIFGNGLVSTSADDRATAFMEETLIAEAQAITHQRLAVLDEGNLDGEGIVLTTAYGTPTAIIGGDDRSGASTGTRLARMSLALTSGQYLYVFDRCIEQGCDTVLIQNAALNFEEYTEQELDAAAAMLGYELYEANGYCRLYHADLGECWGTVSQYSAIGIGTTAYYTALGYPAMRETDDTNLNHYTFDELKQYQLVLLSGFTYDDRDAAESLVLALSEAGVRVVIEADGIPESRATHDRSFLGVVCNAIEFKNGYPELDTVIGEINADLFPQGYTTWETFFTQGLDDVWGTVYDQSVELPFIGTAKNENIVFVGLNLSYHYALTGDNAVGDLLALALDLDENTLPSREIVPMTVTAANRSLTITTDADNVNTGFAWQDFMRSDSELKNDNRLLVVSSGVTEISLIYPDLWIGIAVLALGIALVVLASLSRRKSERERKESLDNEV